MSKVALLSIKPEYSARILDRSKDIELRHSTFGFKKGDIAIVYESAPKQCLGFWFKVAGTETLPVRQMWNLHGQRLGIDAEDFDGYFAGCEKAVGLHVADVCRLDPPIPLARIKELVPDFVPPQNIIWIKGDSIIRFFPLLREILPPLPRGSIPQGTLLDLHDWK